MCGRWTGLHWEWVNKRKADRNLHFPLLLPQSESYFVSLQGWSLNYSSSNFETKRKLIFSIDLKKAWHVWTWITSLSFKENFLINLKFICQNQELSSSLTQSRNFQLFRAIWFDLIRKIIVKTVLFVQPYFLIISC